MRRGKAAPLGAVQNVHCMIVLLHAVKTITEETERKTRSLVQVAIVDDKADSVTIRKEDQQIK